MQHLWSDLVNIYIVIVLSYTDFSSHLSAKQLTSEKPLGRGYGGDR